MKFYLNTLYNIKMAHMHVCFYDVRNFLAKQYQQYSLITSVFNGSGVRCRQHTSHHFVTLFFFVACVVFAHSPNFSCSHPRECIAAHSCPAILNVIIAAIATNNVPTFLLSFSFLLLLEELLLLHTY